MPQLDVISYFSQFVTFVFIMGTVYGVVVLWVLPTIKCVGLIREKLELQSNLNDSVSLYSCRTLLAKIIS